MKNGLAILFAAPAALLLGSAAPAAPGASLGEDYLFRLVPARSGVRFVSFGPDNPQDWFWRDEPRTNAWTRRVSEKTGVPASAIFVQPFSRPVAVLADYGIAPSEAFAKRLRAGDRAVSLANGRTDGGDPTVRTNAFTISKFANDGVSDIELGWIPDGRFRLRSDQGAGAEIWAVTWDELRARWDSDAPGDVRRELWSLDRVRANVRAPGAGRWHDRFLGYWTNHPALWPGFAINNDRPEDVLVRYRIRRDGDSGPWSQDLRVPANGRESVAALADPHRGYDVEWTFRPAEGGLCPQCCKVQEKPWLVDGYVSEKTVTVPGPRDADPYKKPPVLEFGESFLVHEDLMESFDRIAGSVEVVYADGTRDTPSVQPPATGRPPCVEIYPERRILEVVFQGNDWFDAQTHRPSRESGIYHCGERAELAGTLKRPAWPKARIRASLSPDAIRHDAKADSVRVAIRVSDERAPRTFEPMDNEWDVPVGKEKEVSLEKELDGFASLPRKDGVRLSVSVSAPLFETWTTNVTGVARGGEGLLFAPVLDPKTEPWPWKELERAIRSTPQFNSVLTPPNRRTLHRNDGDETLAAQIWTAFSDDSGNKAPKAEPLDGLKHHLDACPGCKACGAFLKRHEARLGKDASGKTDRLSVLLAAWEEVYPARAKEGCPRADVVDEATGRTAGPSNAAVLEAVMRNHLGKGETAP